MTVYDAGTANNFVAKPNFNLASSLVTTILEISCVEDSRAGTYYFSCAILSGTHSLAEIYFELNPATYTVRKVNETNYQRFKDFALTNLIMKSSFIAGPAIGINQTSSAVLVYRRKALGGSEYLYGGIDSSQFNNKAPGDIMVDLYSGDQITKLYVLPKEGKSEIVFKLDYMKAQVNHADLTSVQGGTITPYGSSPFSLTDVFSENKGSQDAVSSSATSNAANSSSNTGLLVGLIVAVIVVVLIIAGLIAFIIWKQGQKTRGSQYVDTQRETNFGDKTSNLRSFDGVKY